MEKYQEPTSNLKEHNTERYEDIANREISERQAQWEEIAQAKRLEMRDKFDSKPKTLPKKINGDPLMLFYIKIAITENL